MIFYMLFLTLPQKMYQLVKMKNPQIDKSKWKNKEFQLKPKSHIELGLGNKDIDFETSIKLSGSRFVVLKIKLHCLSVHS